MDSIAAATTAYGIYSRLVNNDDPSSNSSRQIPIGSVIAELYKAVLIVYDRLNGYWGRVGEMLYSRGR